MHNFFNRQALRPYTYTGAVFRFSLAMMLLVAMALTGISPNASVSAATPKSVVQIPMSGQGPEIIVTPTSGLVTTESGGTATFTVALATNPQLFTTVAISVVNNKLSEANINNGSGDILFFTDTTPQTVTLTGLDDNIVDGDQPYTITLDPNTLYTTDLTYKALAPVTVSATNIAVNTPPGLVISRTSGLVTTESGGTDTFTVHLKTQPLQGVNVYLNSSNTAEGVVSANNCQNLNKASSGCATAGPGVNSNLSSNQVTLFFSSYNWSDPALVTLTGVDDAPPVVDGDIPYNISIATQSNGQGYNGLTASVSAINLDNDVAGSATVTPQTGLKTSPAQETVTFTIVLNKAPTADVTIPLSSSDPTKGTITVTFVTFTPANWNVPQTVSVTGNPNNPGNFSIITGPATSADTLYNGYNAADVLIANLGKPSSSPADLYVSLRVSPDREYNVPSTEFLTYTFEIRNIGPGRAGSAYLRLPLASGLQPAASAFLDLNTWVEKIVTDTDQPYVQVRLPGLDSSGLITGTISFVPKVDAVADTTIFTRATVYWDDNTSVDRTRGSNAVRYNLVSEKPNRNDTGGEVQFFTQVGEPVGTILTLRSDFYAPNEVVSRWYTPASGESVGLGTDIADNNGVLTFAVDLKNWPVGQPITVAGRGNQSGVIGSTLVTVSPQSNSQSSQLKVTLGTPEKAELNVLRHPDF